MPSSPRGPRSDDHGQAGLGSHSARALASGAIARAPTRARPLPAPARIGTGPLRGWVVAAIAASLALGALSLALPSFQTEDPWSWLVWGREVAHLSLNTRGGPSWKPLPVLFTTILSPLGAVAPYLWLCIARAGGVFAVAVCYRLAKRFGGIGAGIVAAAALLLAPDWLRYMAHGTSEPLMAAFSLLAIERHLAQHKSQAFVCAVAASLARPEAWPFVLGYGVYLALREPARRWFVVTGFALIGLLWFGADFWGSGNPIHGAQTAHGATDSLAHSAHPLLLLAERTGWLVQPLVALLAVVCVMVALRRRSRTELAIAAGSIAWLSLVAAMTVAGYPGDTRFLVPATAALCVLGGIGAARSVACAPRGLKRNAAWMVVAAALCAAWVPNASVIVAHAKAQPREARLYTDLIRATRLGPKPRLTAWDSPTIAPPSVRWLKPALAWQLNLPLAAVHAPDIAQPIPGQAVVFWHRPAGSDEAASYLRQLTPAQPRLIAGDGTWQVFVLGPRVSP